MAQKINGNGVPADLESKLRAAADKLRSRMDSSEDKDVVLGLILLKYISDAFRESFAGHFAARLRILPPGGCAR